MPICRHSLRSTNNGKQVTLVVNGQKYVFWSNSRSCHEAAYRSLEVALRLARRLGNSNVIVQCNSPLVSNQMTGVWRTRAAAMKKRQQVCERIVGNIKVTYI